VDLIAAKPVGRAELADLGLHLVLQRLQPGIGSSSTSQLWLLGRHRRSLAGRVPASILC